MLLLALAHPFFAQTPNPVSTQHPTIGVQSSAHHDGRIYVDGVTYPLTQPGIQQALDDACAGNQFGTYGTDVYLPPVVVSLSNMSGQQFLETCSLQIHGAGLYSTWFVVDGKVPSTVPVFRVKPVHVGSQGAMSFENFQITSGGSAGGDAFLFDGSNPGISGFNNLTIRKVMVTGLSKGAWSLNMVGPAFPANQMGWNRVSDNILQHGIRLTNALAVDSWLIDHNVFGSATGGTTPCIDASTVEGASHITAFNNNGGCAGGFFISHGTTQCKVLYNQIEQPTESTEPNSAIIDLIGDNYPIDGCEIVGNNINAHTFATTNIRIGRASNTSIYDNVLGLQPKSGVGILLTASSSLSRIPFNDFLGASGGAVAYKNDSVVSNFSLQGADGSLNVPAISFMNEPNSGLLRSGAGRISVDILGKNILEVSPTGTTMGSSAGYCHTAAGNPHGAAVETCLNQLAPGVVGIGTGSGENKSGLIQSGNTVRVATDFTTAHTTKLQTIAGLSWNLPATALTYSFHCSLSYSDSTASSEVAFGIQAANNAPQHLFANATMQVDHATFSGGTLSELRTIKATTIVRGLPAAAHRNFTATIDGTIENRPSMNTINIMVASQKLANAVTIKRGSYCQLY